MAESKAAILVVEDELAIQRGLCDVLAFHGYEPEGIERGDDGLHVAQILTFGTLAANVIGWMRPSC